MSRVQILAKVDPSLKLLLFPQDASLLIDEVNGWKESGLTVRVLRGRKMRVVQGLFDEFAAALQFPLYFGENRDAFDECLSELEGLSTLQGHVLVIVEPGEVLLDEEDEALAWFVSSLSSAAAVWGEAISVGEWWDRPPVPFHVVLTGAEEVVAQAEHRWRAAGAPSVAFPSGF